MAASFKGALWLDIEAELPPQPETNTLLVDKAKTDNCFDVSTTYCSPTHFSPLALASSPPDNPAAFLQILLICISCIKLSQISILSAIAST